MKIRNLSRLALAIAVSSTVLLEGCKKYDDDITRLEQGIDQNSSDLESLKTQLQSISATNVVESVTAIAGGFKVNFKKPDGTTFSYDITNGTNGTNGANGTNGTPGTMWQIDPTSSLWQSSSDGGATWKNSTIKATGTNGSNGKDGADGKDGKDGENGTDGTDGTNGTNGKDAKLEIKSASGGKYYWFIDGVNTNVIAAVGDVSLVKTDGGYNVVMTDASGMEQAPVFLATEAIAVNSLALVPEVTNSNSPIVFFPRIVDANNTRVTILQGYGHIKYNLNPFGVATANYDATGLLTQTTDKVTFRSSGAAVNPNFVVAGTAVKTFGDISVKFKPVNANNLFPNATAGEDLHVALQVKNNKAASNQQFVASSFNVAKEEIVEKDEVTIEKSARNPQSTGDQVTLLNGVNPSFSAGAFIDAGASSSALAHTKVLADARTASNFTLHFKNNAASNLDNNTNYVGGIVLDDALNGFYGRTQVNNVIVSMDDHGLSDYNLRYDLDHYAPSAQERDWLTLDPETGKISVKISTTNSNTYNAAAINNFAVVRAKIFAGTSSAAPQLIGTRFIKINFVQDIAQDIAVNGTIAHQVVNAVNSDKTITWSTPLTLDAAYNKTSRPAADFHAVYTFTPSSTNPAGFTFDMASMNHSTQGTPRVVAIANTVMPGTYTLKGEYRSSISVDPVVKVTITVNVGGNLVSTLTKDAPFWDTALTYGIINGKLVGTDWKLQADLWDYWTENVINNPTKPVTTYEYSVVNPLTGFAVTADEVVLNEALLAARNKVNNGHVILRVTRKVNGVVFNLPQTDFNVRFINPVKAIAVKTVYKEFKDKEVSGSNTSNVDVRRLIKLSDFNNVTLFDFNNNPATNVFNSTLVSDYGITGVDASYSVSDVTFTRAENANGTAISLQGGARAFVSGDNLVWENLGANLQQPIYLIYTVRVKNKFNLGDVASTKSEVMKEVRIKVNPNI